MLHTTLTPNTPLARKPYPSDVGDEEWAFVAPYRALASVDAGYTGERPGADAAAHGIPFDVVQLPEANHGFVLLPRRWVVESTQPHYPPCSLDVQYPACHDRAHRAA